MNDTRYSPAYIKSLLADKSITARHIATSCEVKTQTVHGVINGTISSTRVAEKIAIALGLKLEEVFGGDYPKKRGRPKTSFSDQDQAIVDALNANKTPEIGAGK